MLPRDTTQRQVIGLVPGSIAAIALCGLTMSGLLPGIIWKLVAILFCGMVWWQASLRVLARMVLRQRILYQGLCYVGLFLLPFIEPDEEFPFMERLALKLTGYSSGR